MRKVRCPYCGDNAVLQSSTAVYGNGRDFGDLYVCANYPRCDAYVGVHKGTDKPLGRLANAELREWKKRAHAAFDGLWRRKMSVHGCAKKKARGKGYRWLSEQMGIDEKRCHIGMFDVEQCQQVVEICKPYTASAPRA